MLVVLGRLAAARVKDVPSCFYRMGFFIAVLLIRIIRFDLRSVPPLGGGGGIPLHPIFLLLRSKCLHDGDDEKSADISGEIPHIERMIISYIDRFLEISDEIQHKKYKRQAKTDCK